VVQSNNTVHLVNLQQGTYSCRQYQANGIPCGHAMTCIFAQGLTLEPYLPTALSTATWIATFASPLPPVSIVGLEPVTDYPCDPPATCVPRGRPKKERIRRNEMRVSHGRGLVAADMGAEAGIILAVISHQCSTYGDGGHNARTCKRPHT
jgi:hypothetical protein